MPVRLRKFLGAIMLIVPVVTWALVAMALAQSPLVKVNGVIEVLYYAVAGLGWVLPAMPLPRNSIQKIPVESMTAGSTSQAPDNA